MRKRFSVGIHSCAVIAIAAAAGYSNPTGPTTNSGVVTTLAGIAPSFVRPYGIAVDSSGNAYVADADDDKIRKITPDGAVTTLAGSGEVGNADGPGASASFNLPTGVAVDSSGNVYVADPNNNTIRKITPEGVVSTFAGSGKEAHVDGPGTSASFDLAYEVAVDSSGYVYVSEGTMIRKISPRGVVTTLAGSGHPGYANGPGKSAMFNGLQGIAVDSPGNVYVADLSNNMVRKITPEGMVTTLAGSGRPGHADGTGAAASFFHPEGLAVDSSGNVYVGDPEDVSQPGRGSVLIRKISPQGVVTTLAGSGQPGHADGSGTAASFDNPEGLAADSSGNIYVADTHNLVIRKISPAGVVTPFAGPASKGHADGPAASSTFDGPQGVAADSSGNVYVADPNNNTIRKITPDGLVTTFAGSASHGGRADGRGAGASFARPEGVAVDSVGNVYVADYGYGLIRKITPTGVVTTLAGSGTRGHADGRGSAASFAGPFGIAADSAGNVYVAELLNNKIRKITPDGVVSTLAGSGSQGYADGPGAVASFRLPFGLAVDSSGNVYVADTGNALIRKISSDGAVTTYAGTVNRGGQVDGPKTSVSFGHPEGIAVDSSGNFYIADYYSNLIRKISADGVVTTLAGSGMRGHADGSATSASFALPAGVAVDSFGNVYVADYGNNSIRRIQLSASLPVAVAPVQQQSVNPGEMVLVQGGTFTMGSPPSESGRGSDEVQHQVTVPSFKMGKYDVTQALYESVMGANPSHFKGDPNLPVESVTWYKAIAFCNALSDLNGLQKVYTISGSNVTADWTANGYRLPTEAEWEYAARGGQKGIDEYHQYAGSDNVDEVGWYAGNSEKMSHPVGQKAPNALGLYDMSGNVLQWCWDVYADYSGGAQTHPTGAQPSSWGVYRGGGWINEARFLRVAYRGRNNPGSQMPILGFRLVRN